MFLLLCCAFFSHFINAQTWNATFEVGDLKTGGNGSFIVEVHPEWAPLGAQRFAELVDKKVLSEARFFRVIHGFMAQFGIPSDPTNADKWNRATIKDDPVVESNRAGYVTFANSGKDTRSSQLFVNLVDNNYLDHMGFAPFGKVVAGFDIVKQINDEYGEQAPHGKGPDQFRIIKEGNTYLTKDFPRLSYTRFVQRKTKN